MTVDEANARARRRRKRAAPRTAQAWAKRLALVYRRVTDGDGPTRDDLVAETGWSFSVVWRASFELIAKGAIGAVAWRGRETLWPKGHPALLENR